jgi:hypothetical protein
MTKKEKAGKVVSTDGDTLMKNGLGGQTIAQWLNPSGKIAISAVTDVKSTESILKYMKKSIPKGNFDKKSYKKFFGEEVEITEAVHDKKSTFTMAPFEDLRSVADAALKIMTRQPQEVKEEEKEEVTKEDQPQSLTE